MTTAKEEVRRGSVNEADECIGEGKAREGEKEGEDPQSGKK